MISDADAAVEHAVRDAAPRAIAALTRRSKNFGFAEDAVQEAVLDAIEQWRRDGIPENPAGWIFTVAARRLNERLASESARRRREAAAANPATDMIDLAGRLDDMDRDPTLEVLFHCCASDLSPAAAAALILRAVVGLTTAEIAGAYHIPTATMAQRISRAKETLRQNGSNDLGPKDRAERVGVVRQALYVMFSEGYVARSGLTLGRIELTAEALRLARALHREHRDSETTALLALMLLTDARRSARTGPKGELIPLDEQDRSLWDHAAIEEGTALTREAFAHGVVGPTAIQAAIAALHDNAPTVRSTDWRQITELYDALLSMAWSPGAALSRIVARAMLDGAAPALADLDHLLLDPRVAQGHRADAVRAHLLEMIGDRKAALTFYAAAAGKTASIPERNYLLLRASRLSDG